MRLANGIIIDKERTFGVLKFSALRREVHIQNEDGTVSEEIKERTYDLKCKEQGRMIQVSIPASVPLKEFDYNAEVEIMNPVADTVATATFQGADVDWYIKADDIVDELFNTVKKELINLIHEDPQNGEQAADLLMIAKYFERIGDHAVNIAGWVIFSITGNIYSEKQEDR